MTVLKLDAPTQLTITEMAQTTGDVAARCYDSNGQIAAETLLNLDHLEVAKLCLVAKFLNRLVPLRKEIGALLKANA